MNVGGPGGEDRLLTCVFSLALGLGVVYLLHTQLPDGLRIILVGSDAGDDFPLTIHAAEWLAFFFGLGELTVRFRTAGNELAELEKGYLPKDERVALQAGRDMQEYYQRARDSETANTRFLPRLIQRIIRQYQGSRSIDQAHSLLNSSMDLFMHEIDLRYSMLRYTAWVIPSLGFIGTVYGIAEALRKAATLDTTKMGGNLLSALTRDLGIAFDTTMLALGLSMVLVFLMHVIQGREERALNGIAQYCTDNLIVRIYKE